MSDASTSDALVPFDTIRPLVKDVLDNSGCPIETVNRIYLIRDMTGRVRVVAPDEARDDELSCNALQCLAIHLHRTLRAHSYSPEDGVLFVSPDRTAVLDEESEHMGRNVFWTDRLMTAGDWWTVNNDETASKAPRHTLFSVKGGVGRSTTGAVLAWHLARRGKRVLVVDLDLEAPGLSSAMLDPGDQPVFGVIDWFVEDLVDQGDRVIERMAAVPTWSQELDGKVYVVPAHGREPGEYLAKMGRVYLHDRGATWTDRLRRMLSRLEDTWEPTIVLLESCSGLHDIAATTVTDLNAQVLLFALDSESHWTDYGILFRHWQQHYGLAARIRERLSIVSALTPELDTERYLRRFRQQAWNLFRSHLYDEAPAGTDIGQEFSFTLDDEDAPHHPLPVHWTRGLAAGASLRTLDRTTVAQAYKDFLVRFDRLIDAGEAVP